MKNFILIPIVILYASCILKSCMFSGCKKVPFNKEDLTWIVNLPKEGDTILYKGSDNTIDTFFVNTNYRGFADCNRFEISEYQPESFIFTIKNINRKTYGSWFRIMKFEMGKEIDENKVDLTSKYFRFYDLKTNNEDLANKIKQEQIKLKYISKTINSITIDHSAADVDAASYRERILNFSWNKEFGLVRYIDTDSVEYEYWKKY